MIVDFLLRNNSITSLLYKTNIRISESNESFNIYEIASDYLKNNRMIFVVLPTLFDAQKYYDLLINIVNEDDVLFFPVDEMVVASLLISSANFKYERINTIISLLEDKPKIVVTNINGILRKNLTKNNWQSRMIYFKHNQEYSIQELRKIFVEYGFINVSKVKRTGEFSIRGSIVDYFPLNTTTPIRLDFFDTEIDSIKLFDPETQRSTIKIDSAVLFPIDEIFYSDETKKEVINILTSRKSDASKEELEIINKDIEKIDQRNEINTLHNYISLFAKSESILDYKENSKIYLINEDKIISIVEEINRHTNQYFKDLNSAVLKEYNFFLNYDELIKNRNITYIDTLVFHKEGIKIITEDINNFYGNFNLLAKEINKRINHCYVILLIKTPDRLKE